MMHNMMSNMSSEQLVAMSRASGHEVSPEQVQNLTMHPSSLPIVMHGRVQCCMASQAEMMAGKMKNMSEAQVQQLLKAASWLQRAVDLARQARSAILANKLLVLGIIMLFVAFALRRLGFV